MIEISVRGGLRKIMPIRHMRGKIHSLGLPLLPQSHALDDV